MFKFRKKMKSMIKHSHYTSSGRRFALNELLIMTEGRLVWRAAALMSGDGGRDTGYYGVRMGAGKEEREKRAVWLRLEIGGRGSMSASLKDEGSPFVIFDIRYFRFIPMFLRKNTHCCWKYSKTLNVLKCAVMESNVGPKIAECISNNILC